MVTKSPLSSICLPFFTHVYLKGDLGTWEELQITFNSSGAMAAHARPPIKLLWRELHNFAGNRFPKASSEALES